MGMQWSAINELCDLVRTTGYSLHGYLRSSRIEHGLLINFGAPTFYIKKYILDAIH